MQELKDGQKAALDIIMERWEIPIKAYIYRLTQAPDWVDELAQETFVKVYINASSFDSSRRFSPWIYTIATNLCRNWRRWRTRHPSMPAMVATDSGSEPLNPLDLIEDPDAPVSAQIEQHEDCSEVKKAIAELPDALRTTIVLYYYQGLSYEEIAETLHCSRRGVETRLYRAKKFLQPRLFRVLQV